MRLPKINRVPSFIKWLYPSWYVWDKISGEKTIYLTFDDGPIPEVTEFVLNTLSRKQNSIPATFFCIGENIQKYPEIFEQLLNEGHTIGNHSFNHLKGTRTDTDVYIENIERATIEISKHITSVSLHSNKKLFRPPYGILKRRQAKRLRSMGYTIVMYRVIGHDWDPSISPEACLNNLVKNTRGGDIIVLHDSLKAYKNMRYALPKAIKLLEEKGFTFGTL